jgi:hypothetical protein
MGHKTCEEKQVYPDLLTAQISAAQINFDQDDRKRLNGRRVKIKTRGEPFRSMEYAPYQCVTCGLYHLTTQKKTVEWFKRKGECVE